MRGGQLRQLQYRARMEGGREREEEEDGGRAADVKWV